MKYWRAIFQLVNTTLQVIPRLHLGKHIAVFFLLGDSPVSESPPPPQKKKEYNIQNTAKVWNQESL